MAVPPIIDAAEFEAVQALLKTRSPALTAPRITSGPTLLTGILLLRRLRHCHDAAHAARAASIATTPARPRPARARPAAKAARCRWTSSTPSWRTTSSIAFAAQVSRGNPVERSPRREGARGAPNDAYRRIAQRASEADAKLKRLYTRSRTHRRARRPMLKDRIAELKAIRDQARADAERAQDAIERVGPSITPQSLKMFARQARKRMRTDSGGYRRAPPPRARPARRSRRERSSHHGSKSVLLSHARRRLKRKNGGFWRAQLCTEVARPTRFELVTSAFGGQGTHQWPLLRPSMLYGIDQPSCDIA